MNRWNGYFGFVTLAVVIQCSQGIAASSPPGGDTGWPRQLTAGDSVITLYQPQVDAWKDYKELDIRQAVGVRGKAETEDKLGVLQGTAQTVVDTSARNVGLSQFKYTLRFPSSDADEAARLEKAVRTALPGTRSITVALDRILAGLDKEKTRKQKEVKVSFDPPEILYSPKPAVLMIFMGEPSFASVKDGDNSLLYALNTNWDLFMAASEKKYYMRDDDSWLESADATNWIQAKQLPAGIQNLPADDNWSETRKHIPGSPAKTIPVVFQTTTPAELIVTDGEPKLRPIANTQIMQVTNTPSLLFLSNTDQQYYFLVAGRWFSAGQLGGPWKAASDSLPADFAQIPATDQISEIRSSVKGTPEAQDAVMLASVPTLATVTKDEATLDVSYEGEPKFDLIPETQVQSAVNTAQDVFLVNGKYYCCSEGVWFVADTANGPWSLCTQVAPEIYDIPAESPDHNVTYVNVYDSGDDYVTYGYTDGYTGSYVCNDLLVFGAGVVAGAVWNNWWQNNANYHIHYPAPVPFYSYGIGAHYNYATGGYFAAANCYGPYGGAGRYAAYNPTTGRYSRGAGIYGPYSSASVRQAYNPWTDTYAARARVNTPTGSAGRFYAERDGESAWGGSRSGPRGGVAWGQTSEGGKGAAWDTRRNEGAAVKTKSGDVFVGNDGNIYKRDDGDWQKYDGGNWNDVNRPDNQRADANRSAAQAGAHANNTNAVNLGEKDFPRTAPVNRPTGDLSGRSSGNLAGETRNPAIANRPQGNLGGETRDVTPRTERTFEPSTFQNLEQQSFARDRGNANTERFQQSTSRASSSSFTPRASSSSRPQQARPSSGAAVRGGGGGGGRRR